MLFWSYNTLLATIERQAIDIWAEKRLAPASVAPTQYSYEEEKEMIPKSKKENSKIWESNPGLIEIIAGWQRLMLLSDFLDKESLGQWSE